MTNFIRTDSENTIPQRISCLRDLMCRRGISACIIPTADPHMSEYVGEHDKTRQYITGFTGSAGTAVITAGDGGLWTDSRYWLQAEDQLQGSGIRLFREGTPGTPSIAAWLTSLLSPGQRISVCGTSVSQDAASQLEKSLAKSGLVLDTDLDLPGEIWTDRPPRTQREISDHPLSCAGIPRTEKIRQIREEMMACGAQALILPALDDIAWLLNLRGSDIPMCPVFFSYVILTKDWLRLYAQSSCFSDDLLQKLTEDGVTVVSYDQFYDDLGRLDSGTDMPAVKSVLLDPQQCNAMIKRSLPASARLLEGPSPILYRKCIKNAVEMDGIRAAHLQDGIAMCQFLHWLKASMASVGSITDGLESMRQTPAAQSSSEETAAVQIPSGQLTELSVSEKLLEFRSRRNLFVESSFETIAACGPHAAIVHYAATEESDMTLPPRGLLLLDSGGQYLNGTTDITRTIALGPVTREEKRLFTAVLRGHIALAKAIFPRGMTGAQLDVLAHQPLWQMGLDYGHGTGHGVGSCLLVHEDPIRIHWRSGRIANLPGNDVVNTADSHSSQSADPCAASPADSGMTPAADSGMCAMPAPARQVTSTLPMLSEGMLFSDEPGYYAADRFGIRHENLLLCVRAADARIVFGNCTERGCNSTASNTSPKTAGDYLGFEPVTLVPFDLDAILAEEMQPEEIDWLNAYHARVYETISPYLEEADRLWLRQATRPIQRQYN